MGSGPLRRAASPRRGLGSRPLGTRPARLDRRPLAALKPHWQQRRWATARFTPGFNGPRRETTGCGSKDGSASDITHEPGTAETSRRPLDPCTYPTPCPTVHFLGRVLPPVTEVTIGHDPTIKWEARDLGLLGHGERRDGNQVMGRHLLAKEFPPDRRVVRLVAYVGHRPWAAANDSNRDLVREWTAPPRSARGAARPRLASGATRPSRGDAGWVRSSR
jgi:hypothetical protein